MSATTAIAVRRACEHAFVAYVELHAHSAYSFLDGSATPAELVGAAEELGYPAFALTDHNGVYGSMEFAQAAKALGLKAMHGVELDVVDVPWTRPRERSPTADLRGDPVAPLARHLTVLVRDATGWANL